MFKINLLKKSNEFSEVWRKKYNLFNFFLHKHNLFSLIEGSLPYYAVVKE